jgi:hypothetical protein
LPSFITPFLPPFPLGHLIFTSLKKYLYGSGIAKE